MLKINRDKQNFSLLDRPTLADVSITERYDLQEFISNSPVGFFREIGQELFLLGKEIQAVWERLLDSRNSDIQKAFQFAVEFDDF